MMFDKIQPDVSGWNYQSFCVMQAMLGIVSPNFRRVGLDHDGSQWIITFFLEHEDADDREELEDFTSEWDALQSCNEPRDVRIIVTAGDIPLPEGLARFLYWRREVIVDPD